MCWPKPNPFNEEQQILIDQVKIYKRNGITRGQAKELLSRAEVLEISHRGPEVHETGETAGREHVHILNYHIFLK